MFVPCLRRYTQEITILDNNINVLFVRYSVAVQCSLTSVFPKPQAGLHVIKVYHLAIIVTVTAIVGI